MSLADSLDPLLDLRHARVLAKVSLVLFGVVVLLGAVLVSMSDAMNPSSRVQFIAANLESKTIVPYGPAFTCSDRLDAVTPAAQTSPDVRGLRGSNDVPARGLEFRVRAALEIDRVLVLESSRITAARMFTADVTGQWSEARRWPDSVPPELAGRAMPAFKLPIEPGADLRLRVCYQAVPLMQPAVSVRTFSGMQEGMASRAAFFGLVACVPLTTLLAVLVFSRRGCVRVPLLLLVSPVGIAHAARVLDLPGLPLWPAHIAFMPILDWITAILTVSFLAYLERDMDTASPMGGFAKWRRWCVVVLASGGVMTLLRPQSGFDALLAGGMASALLALVHATRAQEHSRHTWPLQGAIVYLLLMYSTQALVRLERLPPTWADAMSAALPAVLSLMVGIHLELQARDRARYRELRLRQEDLRAKAAVETHAAERLRLFASANHDLRQPVQSIGILATLLHAKAREPSIAHIARRLVQSYDSLSTLVDGLLDVARLDASAMRPQLSVFALEEILVRLAGEYRDVAAAKGLELRHVPCRVYVRSDKRLLERILRNLLTNAVEHTEQGRVLLGGRRRRGGRVEVQVLDTGIGIEPDVCEQLVTSRYRPMERQGRAGLGLFIVMELAAVLHHPISVESRADKGSRFGVSLAIEPLGARALCEPVVAASSFAGLRVLCLDDDATLLESLQMLLESKQCRVCAARNRRQALDALVRGFSPDVAIIDTMLAPDNGALVLAHLEGLLGRNIPAILLSGSVSPRMLDEFDRADRLMARKPVDPEALLAMLNALAVRKGGTSAVEGR